MAVLLVFRKAFWGVLYLPGWRLPFLETMLMPTGKGISCMVERFVTYHNQERQRGWESMNQNRSERERGRVEKNMLLKRKERNREMREKEKKQSWRSTANIMPNEKRKTITVLRRIISAFHTNLHNQQIHVSINRPKSSGPARFFSLSRPRIRDLLIGLWKSFEASGPQLQRRREPVYSLSWRLIYVSVKDQCVHVYT